MNTQTLKIDASPSTRAYMVASLDIATHDYARIFQPVYNGSGRPEAKEFTFAGVHHVVYC